MWERTAAACPGGERLEQSQADRGNILSGKPRKGGGMRKEERARHANTSASSFQPKQNPQQPGLVRKETDRSRDLGERGGAAGKVLGTGGSGSLRVTWGESDRGGEAPSVTRACPALYPQVQRLGRKGMWTLTSDSCCSFRTRSGTNSSQSPQARPLGCAGLHTGGGVNSENIGEQNFCT